MKNFKQLVKELPSKSVVITIGRFNPPTLGSELQIKVARKVASQNKCDHIIFVANSQVDKKNPLSISQKLDYLKNIFPNTIFKTFNGDSRNIEAVCNSVKNKYKSITLVTAENNKQIKQFCDKNNIKVVAAGKEDPDADTRALSSASRGEFAKFKSQLPTNIRDLDAKRMMNDIRIACNLDPIKEELKLVKDDLRELYFRGEIFNEGDIVESDGNLYSILKRGSNHLLLLGEDDNKVSKWINQVKEFKMSDEINKLDEEGYSDQESVVQAAARGSKTAEMERRVQELKVKHAKQSEDLKGRQTAEVASLRKNQAAKMESTIIDAVSDMLNRGSRIESPKEVVQEAEEVIAEGGLPPKEPPTVDTKSNYNIARSVMSLSDYRKMTAQDHGAEIKPNENDKDNPITDGPGTDSHPDTKVGGHHMVGRDEQHRRRKVKYHLGEDKYKGLEKEDEVQVSVAGAKDKGKKGKGVDIDTVEGWKEPDIGFKKTETQVIKKGSPVKEETVTSVKDVHAPVAKPKESGTVNKVADSRYGSPVGTKSAVKEEAEDFSDLDVYMTEENIQLMEMDLANLTEDAIIEMAYDDNELALIDEETGEFYEEVELEEEQNLMEVLSRQERLKMRVRLKRSQNVRNRNHRIALKQMSSPKVANNRARRLAIQALKKRLSAGVSPRNLSVGQKERIERFIAQRKQVVDRLSSRMVPSVKRIEKARLAHKRYTRPAQTNAF